MTPQYRNHNNPANLPSDIDPESYQTIIDLFNNSVRKYADKPANTCMGKTMTYAELDELSADFASYLQNHTDLKPGDRIAIQLPNILQFPVVAFGALRAGLVIVNTNPLYTERELEHQFNDSGAVAVVVYAAMAQTVQAVQPKTGVKTVIVTQIGDMHGLLKRKLLNTVVKRVKKMIPPYDKSQTLSLLDCLKLGREQTYRAVKRAHEDIAVLQYTGGTTGVAKGAMLTNRNLIANMLQCAEFFKLVLKEGEETIAAPLPLYHIYAFTVNCLLMPHTGNHNLLIPNPRDLPAYVGVLQKNKFTAMTGLNTLFVALMNNKDFCEIDFSPLKLTISGGMALMHDTAEHWEKLTGNVINEGYGLTETSPVVSFNPPGHAQLGTIGVPAPSTDVRVINDKGEELGLGEVGELCVRGPQVMKGYWNRPQDTDDILSEDGWLQTGDIAIIKDDFYIKIVDRKKDMINVSGFNVYPNEIEDVLSDHPDVVECAAIGVPSESTGETIKVFVVTSRLISDKELTTFCRERLTAYKVPKIFEFKDELPKTNVGKVLRRNLREPS